MDLPGTAFACGRLSKIKGQRVDRWRFGRSAVGEGEVVSYNRLISKTTYAILVARLDMNCRSISTGFDLLRNWRNRPAGHTGRWRVRFYGSVSFKGGGSSAMKPISTLASKALLAPGKLKAL